MSVLTVFVYANPMLVVCIQLQKGFSPAHSRQGRLLAACLQIWSDSWREFAFFVREQTGQLIIYTFLFFI